LDREYYCDAAMTVPTVPTPSLHAALPIFTASDCSGSLAVTCTDAFGNPVNPTGANVFPIGETDVTCSATNPNGPDLTSSCFFEEVGREHALTAVTWPPRMPSSAGSNADIT